MFSLRLELHFDIYIFQMNFRPQRVKVMLAIQTTGKDEKYGVVAFCLSLSPKRILSTVSQFKVFTHVALSLMATIQECKLPICFVGCVQYFKFPMLLERI